jgi:UDP-3-O-[3-hydroxymyristoyl] glucosamine N-acyltransferase
MYRAINSSLCRVSASLISEQVKGELLGDSSKWVSSLAPIDKADSTSLSFANQKGLKNLLSSIRDGSCKTVPGILLCSAATDDIKESLSQLSATTSLIFVQQPQKAFISCIHLFFEKIIPTPTISPLAEVHHTAMIGQGVSIGAFCSIGANCIIEDSVSILPNTTLYPDVTIGARSIIHAGSIIREGVVLGKDCVIQPGAVIGADGFGFLPDSQLGLLPVPQVGSVVLGDRVEVGANSCVDRGAVGNTSISLGTKVDNLVQIGHNVQIGSFSVVCGSSAIGGSTTIGNQCILGGRTGVADHLTIPSHTTIAGNSGVERNITEAGVYRGFPIEKDIPWRRQQASLRALPMLVRKLKRETPAS